jgi:hypothetical protein
MGFPFSSGDVLTAADMNGIGSWVSFTPSWNNFTIGNGIENWWYCVVNEMLFISGRTVWGNTTSQTGALQMEIPYGTSIMNLAQPVGSANYLENTSGTNYVGFITTQSSTTLGFREFNVSGSFVTQANVFATSPFTWNLNDSIRATMTLRLT